MEPLETVAEYLVSSDDREARGNQHRCPSPRYPARGRHPHHASEVQRSLDGQIARIQHRSHCGFDQRPYHDPCLCQYSKDDETIVQKLRPFLGDLVAGHHGSMDKNIRLDVEKKLKYGHLRAVVTSSSLEMGIDIGSVDLVLQVGSQVTLRQRSSVSGVPATTSVESHVSIFANRRGRSIELAALQAAIQTGDMDRLDFPQTTLTSWLSSSSAWSSSTTWTLTKPTKSS